MDGTPHSEYFYQSQIEGNCDKRFDPGGTKKLSDKLVFVPFLSLCMYSMTGKGQTAQKDHIGAKIAKLRENISI